MNMPGKRLERHPGGLKSEVKKKEKEGKDRADREENKLCWRGATPTSRGLLLRKEDKVYVCPPLHAPPTPTTTLQASLAPFPIPLLTAQRPHKPLARD